MAGHSKWANTKFRKERVDAKKSKVFLRISKEIISSVKRGGSDPRNNSELRFLIQKAKSVNFPRESIERNIKKAVQVTQLDYETIWYEIYGFGGVGIIVQVMTDNKNHVLSEMRLVISKKGGNMAAPGAVLFNFNKKGVILITGLKQYNFDTIYFAGIEGGAEEIEETEDGIQLVVPSNMLFQLQEKLEQFGGIMNAHQTVIPKMVIQCDSKDREANIELLMRLEEVPDVDVVYHNME
ncbi:MAG: YebC/PmpR family DNA-binding transcriptional regulator [Chlamydiales bacterium]